MEKDEEQKAGEQKTEGQKTERQKAEEQKAYSSVPNNRTCTLINFWENFSPGRSYWNLHVYLFCNISKSIVMNSINSVKR